MEVASDLSRGIKAVLLPWGGYLSRFCSWRGMAHSSRRRRGGRIPRDRRGDTVPPQGGRADLERSSGSRPLRPRRTRRSWGRTSRTTWSRRYHSDYGTDCGATMIDYIQLNGTRLEFCGRVVEKIRPRRHSVTRVHKWRGAAGRARWRE